MIIARVTGHVIATQKVASMAGRKLLVVEPLQWDRATQDRLVGTGKTSVVVDALGAGAGQVVLVCSGSSARLTPETADLPIDAVVIGIVDSVRIADRTVFTASVENAR